MQPGLSRILRRAADYWGVPVTWLGVESDRVERVVVTTAILDPGVRSLVLQHSSLLHPGNFRNVAECQSFPAAALVGELPLSNEAAFVGVWREQSLEAALSMAVINPLLRTYGQHLMLFTTSFLRLYGLGNSRSIGGWAFNRLRQPRYFLHATLKESEILAGASFERVVQSLPDSKKSFFQAEGFNARPPASIRSKPTLDQRIENELRKGLAEGGVTDETAIAVTITAVHDAILFDLESAMDAGVTCANPSLTGHSPYSVAAGGDARFYSCSIPSEGVLGAGDIETLVRQCLKDAFDPTVAQSAEAAAILISSAVWHPITELQTLKIQGGLAASCIKTRTRPSQTDLHEHVGATFFRRMPDNLAALFILLQEKGFPQEDAINRYMSAIKPWFSASRLRQSLIHVCPTVWEFPPVLPLVGLYPLSERSPALRSYCRIDERYLALCGRWLRLFAPSIDEKHAPMAVQFQPCGSPNVPKLSELQMFGAVVQKLLNEKLPENRHEALCKLNAISCGLQLFGTSLLGGLRNWPMAIPADGATGWYGYQKAPFIYKPASLISECLPAYRLRLEELTSQCVDAGIEIDWIALRPFAFTLLKIDSRNRLIPAEFNATAIATTLALCPQTRRWQGLYSGGMRHFSMTELYAAGFATNDVEAFHHRSLSSLHPFRIHRLESVSTPDARLVMEMHLRSLVQL